MNIRKIRLPKENPAVFVLPGVSFNGRAKRSRPTHGRPVDFPLFSTVRRAIAMLLVLVCLPLSLPGCASDGKTSEGDGRLLVLATNFALYDLCRVYESDNVRVEMLISPGAELHDMEATLSDVAKVAEADILLYAGGESDGWIDGVFASLDVGTLDVGTLDVGTLDVGTLDVGASDGGAKQPVLLRAMDLAVTHANEGTSSTPEKESGHPGEEDEHVWLSLKNAMAIVRAVGEAIRQQSQTLPADGTDETDEADYLRSLESLDQAYRAVIAKAPLSQIVVADRFPFAVLAAEYGLTYEAAFDGCSSNVDIPLSTLNRLIGTVEKNGLPAVFYVEFSDGTAAETVAKETGAVPLLLHSCHNVTVEELEAGVTYLDLMKQNLTNLAFALGIEEESA